jgi:hypothetical protein
MTIAVTMLLRAAFAGCDKECFRNLRSTVLSAFAGLDRKDRNVVVFKC